MSDTDWHGVRGVNAELIRNINSLKIELAEARMIACKRIENAQRQERLFA